MHRRDWLLAALLLCPASVVRGADGDPSVVVHGANAARGRVIAASAEQFRSRAFERLLGDAAPSPWVERCAIHVHATPGSFADVVGAPPTVARGATSLEFAGDRVVSRRIDVMGDGVAAVPDALAHEMVHVVLADRFVASAPPRWADEGLALLFDSPVKQRRHEADFRAAERHGLAFSAADLLALHDYPADGRRQQVFYGQSAALVRWLIGRRDAATFVTFVDDAGRDGVSAALARHYAIDSVAALDAAWREVPPIETFSLSER